MRSSKAEDNMGLAFKYARAFLQDGDRIDETEVYSDALFGLFKAERKYDPNRKNKFGETVLFSSAAWSYMRQECFNGFRTRKRQALKYYPIEGVEPSSIPDPFNYDHLSEPLVEMLRGLKLEGSPKKSLDMLLMYYLEELTLEEVAGRYGCTKEAVRQRIKKIKEYIAETVNIDALDDDFIKGESCQ